MLNGKLKDTRRYIITTYLLFWCLVGVVAAGVFASGRNMTLMQWGSILPSWTPTIVLLIMFKRLIPGITVKEWFKKAFASRIHLSSLFAVTAALVAAMAATVWMVAWRSQQPASGVLNLSLPALASGVFFALVQGATGEEAGWRGYLQPILEKKAGGVIQGSLLVGLVWSFWHTPLWFATGLLGWNLALYITTFIMGNLALAVIIGVCYHRSRNLLVPMWIHFVSNVIATPYAGDPIEGHVWLVLFYVLAAAGSILWHVSTSRKEHDNHRLPLGA